jgi:hypothetical protein
MACTKNIRKAWIWSYLGPHDERVTRLGRFMVSAGDDDFMVRWTCKLCGAERVEHFVTEDQLLQLGVPIEQIEAARYTTF